jgi:outer membrane protein TolC
VVSAVKSNLGIQFSRLQPAINEADVVSAESVFDAVLFTTVDMSKVDQPATVPLIDRGPGLDPVAIGVPFRGNEEYRFETGLRKLTYAGTEVRVSTDLRRYRNTGPGLSLLPDPAYTSSVRVGVSQPLLRGFGSEVNTASIRLARNNERRSVQQLRSDLLNLVDRTESLYWDLVNEWQELAIRYWLVQVGIEVRDVLESRLEFDTKLSEYADAVARVAQREAEVIRGRRRVRAISDRLKVLMNDPNLTIGSEVVLSPLDHTIEEPIRYSLRDSIVTALQNRPEIQQAILDIDDASIRQMLADNARLPMLNLTAEMVYTGLDDTVSDSYDALTEGNFIDYLFGMLFETPIGNRGPQAEYRRARLERTASVIAYRGVVQVVVADVKAALRDVITNYELIQATRSFRVAQAENLRVLDVEEDWVASLTPTFLDLKFTQQERFAFARRDEVRALAAYDQAVAALHRAMGTGLKMNQIDLEIVDAPDGQGAGAPDADDDSTP